MKEDSKEFFKAVAAITTEQAMAEAQIGRKLHQRWLNSKQRHQLELDGRDHTGEVLAVTTNSVYCKLYRTNAAGIDCLSWFSAKEFVNVFNDIAGLHTD